LAASAITLRVTPQRNPSAVAGDGSFEAIRTPSFGVAGVEASGFPRGLLTAYRACDANLSLPAFASPGFAGNGPSRRFESRTFGGAD